MDLGHKLMLGEHCGVIRYFLKLKKHDNGKEFENSPKMVLYIRACVTV